MSRQIKPKEIICIKEPMNEKNNIKEENEALKKEFPLLFGLKKENPFSSPDGYFDELEFKTKLLIEAENTPFAEHEKNDIPDGYFDKLENQLRVKIELDALKTEAFGTPENYFENLENQIKTTFFLDALREQSFLVPEDYFNESEDQLKTLIYLAEYRNTEVFAVPADYFETFESRLRKKIEQEQKPETKIIPLNTFRPKLKYLAAAAALAGVCVMIWFFMKGKGSGITTAPIELSALDKRQVIENPSAYGIDDNAVLELLNQNPQLLENSTDAAELTDEAMNEIVLDKDVDISTIIGSE